MLISAALITGRYMKMTAAQQQLDTVPHTHSQTMMMLIALSLLESKFWFDFTQHITFNFMFGNISLQFTGNFSQNSTITKKSHFF